MRHRSIEDGFLHEVSVPEMRRHRRQPEQVPDVILIDVIPAANLPVKLVCAFATKLVTERSSLLLKHRKYQVCEDDKEIAIGAQILGKGVARMNHRTGTSWCCTCINFPGFTRLMIFGRHARAKMICGASGSGFETRPTACSGNPCFDASAPRRAIGGGAYRCLLVCQVDT